MEAAGDIYLDKYAGWYSVRDEAYYDESETARRRRQACASARRARRSNGSRRRAISSGSRPTRTSCSSSTSDDPDFVLPKERCNEVTSFVQGGLQDLSISRTTFDWGVKVPGDPRHVMYVWVDALTNYITAVGYPDTDSEKFRRYWPADLHVIGKDIVRFHAVYWPAFLMSAGVEVPQRIFSHGFLFNRGEKMSKSVGNVIDPFALVDDLWRRSAALFLPARSAVRPGRQLQPRSDRQPHQRRPRQRSRQSGAALADHGGAEFRRRVAGAGRVQRERRGDPRRRRRH